MTVPLLTHQYFNDLIMFSLQSIGVNIYRVEGHLIMRSSAIGQGQRSAINRSLLCDVHLIYGELVLRETIVIVPIQNNHSAISPRAWRTSILGINDGGNTSPFIQRIRGITMVHDKVIIQSLNLLCHSSM